MKKRPATAPNPFKKGISDYEYLTELARGLEFFAKSLVTPDKSDKDAVAGEREMKRAFRESAIYIKAYAETFRNASIAVITDSYGNEHVAIPEALVVEASERVCKRSNDVTVTIKPRA